MSKWALVPALALSVIATTLFVPSLLRDRELVAATPSPRPLFDLTPVEFGAGEELCIADVTIPSDAEELRLQVATRTAPGPALELRLQAPGYEERLIVPRGYPDEALVTAAMRAPAATRLGRVCIAHDGPGTVALAGTMEDRTQSRPRGALAGEPLSADTYLAFYERERGSALAHVPDVIERMSAFRPGIVGPWLGWPLLALVVIGVPAGVLWAILRAARA
jgi:hypothetical protein